MTGFAVHLGIDSAIRIHTQGLSQHIGAYGVWFTLSICSTAICMTALCFQPQEVHSRSGGQAYTATAQGLQILGATHTEWCYQLHEERESGCMHYRQGTWQSRPASCFDHGQLPCGCTCCQRGSQQSHQCQEVVACVDMVQLKCKNPFVGQEAQHLVSPVRIGFLVKLQRLVLLNDGPNS